MIWTICFLVKDNNVCLAMKKRGHGEGKWNGTGGKPLEGESLEDTAKRETLEEIGVTVLDITKAAEIEFRDLPTGTSSYATAYILTKWEGDPVETEEMKPKWFDKKNLPYNHMWEADKIWIPEILKGRTIKAIFEYEDKGVLASSHIEDM